VITSSRPPQTEAPPESLYGRRWATRALALEEADARQAQYLREGGVLIAYSRRAAGANDVAIAHIGNHIVG
jgi:hypothetical protein